MSGRASVAVTHPRRRYPVGVNKERVELWAQALESEQYVQCYSELRLAVLEGYDISRTKTLHCALGVGIAVALANGCEDPYSWEGVRFSQEVLAWYGFEDEDVPLKIDEDEAVGVIYINDELKLPFWDIAQAIRTTYLKDDDVHGN